ncbi:hypothetical protein ACIBHX_46260 [Nonomuraea sp. NPDC050536]|uniref:hypothetical protein n=1 Tax=Nonomuraea sp. NPDC050536 TaxID=3364366 RepID=UPI0037C9A993
MFAHDVHLLLALVTTVAMLVVAADGAVRVASGSPPGRIADVGAKVLLVLVMMAAAGGLALLVSEHRPGELLHGMYAFLALGAVPVADSLFSRTSTRPRALARCLGAVVGVVILVRLFNTG